MSGPREGRAAWARRVAAEWAVDAADAEFLLDRLLAATRSGATREDAEYAVRRRLAEGTHLDGRYAGRAARA